MKTTYMKTLMGSLLILLVGLICGGCESDSPLVVEGSVGNAEIILHFDETMTDKSPGTFDITFKMHPESHDDGDHNYIIRNMEVKDWVVQGMLEIPAHQYMMINAEATINGSLHTGSTSLELHEGEVASVELFMYH